MPSAPRPVVCTLTSKDAVGQAFEWSDLRGKAIAVEALTGGARIRFPSDLESHLGDLTKREAECCAFLDFMTVVADGELILDITSPNPDALPVIALLAGLPSGA